MDPLDKYFARQALEDKFFKEEIAQTKEMLYDVLSGEEKYSRVPVIIALDSNTRRIRFMRMCMRKYMTFYERQRFQLRLQYRHDLGWSRGELVVVPPDIEFKVDGRWIEDMDAPTAA